METKLVEDPEGPYSEEERRAWDMYAAAVNAAVDENGNWMTDTSEKSAKAADDLLRERRKRFGKAPVTT